MTAILSCLVGILGMLALWTWAWWLWKQSALPPPTQPSEPTPTRKLAAPPPSWLFGGSPPEDDDSGVPVARSHSSSNTTTSLFARDESYVGSFEERTEVLEDDQLSSRACGAELSTQPASGKTCKIGLFAGPQLPDSR